MKTLPSKSNGGRASPAAAWAPLALAALALVCGAACRERGVGVAVPAGATPEGGGWDAYDPDPAHVWNRLHRSLYLRVARDGREYGRDALDPLLWQSTGHLLGGASNRQAAEHLDEFLDARAERLAGDPLKRAVLQRDLWAVFDWTARRTNRPTPELRGLQSRLALPPDLLRPGGAWVQLGVAGGAGDAAAPAHVFGADGRSVFRVLISLPAGREATLAYLKSVAGFPKPWVRNARAGGDPRPNPGLPQFPAGTRLALVRQMLVVDERGEPAPTAVTESVQIRVHRAIPADIPEAFSLARDDARPALAVYEFRLSRGRLFAGEAGGLRAVARDETEFPLFQSHGPDPFESGGASPGSLGSHLRPALGSCTQCHFRPGIHSALSRVPDLVRLRARDVRRDLTPSPDPAREADLTRDWKTKRGSWRLLRELWP